MLANNKITEMKNISSQNFPNSHNFRLENSKNIGKFDPEHLEADRKQGFTTILLVLNTLAQNM